MLNKNFQIKEFDQDIETTNPATAPGQHILSIWPMTRADAREVLLRNPHVGTMGGTLLCKISTKRRSAMEGGPLDACGSAPR